jgi:subtilisin family serine protease
LVEILVVIFIIGMLSSMTFVMTSTAIQAVNRIEKDVAAATLELTKGPETRDRSRVLGERFLVVFKNSVQDPKAEVERICGADYVEVVYQYYRTFKGASVKASIAALAALQKASSVRYVDQEKIFYATAQISPTGVRRMNMSTNRSFSGIQTGAPSLSPVIRNLTPVTNTGPFGGAVNIAIVDSGVDSTHPDLNVVVKKAFGQTTPEDVDGHGTHVAGSAAARSNSIGVVGVCPGARIWNYRVLDDTGGGTTSDILAAIDDIAQFADQIQVVNMSLGGPFDQTLNDAVDSLVRLGIVVVVAAGNDTGNGPEDVKDFSPASAPLAICVAALSDSDGRAGGRGKKLAFNGDPDDTFASYSFFGPGVAVIAPGTDILSTTIGNTYGLKSGTSMASPHVAGLVGVLRAPKAAPDQTSITVGRIGNLLPIDGQPPLVPVTSTIIPDPAQVRQILIQSATEQIPGLSSNSDKRTYPLVTGRGF